MCASIVVSGVQRIPESTEESSESEGETFGGFCTVTAVSGVHTISESAGDSTGLEEEHPTTTPSKRTTERNRRMVTVLDRVVNLSRRTGTPQKVSFQKRSRPRNIAQRPSDSLAGAE